MKLETERLILRKPKEEDWKIIYENASPDTMSNFTTPSNWGQKLIEKLIQDFQKDWGKGSYRFIIEDKKTKTFIVMISISEINQINKTAKTRSWISKKFRKKGYITEAKISINDFSFNKLKLRKLNSNVIITNKTSNSTQKKCGYFLEGCKRKEYYNSITKKYIDINIYGLLKPEWKQVAPKLKKDLKNKIKKLK